MHRRVFSFLTILVIPISVVFSQEHGKKISDEVRDDPQARAQFEWLRLHDPSTGEIPFGIRQKELKFAATLPTKESFRRLNKHAGIDYVQSLEWSHRGPYNVGGRTRALAIDVANSNTLLAGGVSGGMWRSVDGGSTWTKMTGLSSLQSVTCIAQDTRSGHTGTWYYGTGEFDGNSATEAGAPFRGDGVFKSTDGGIDWSQLPSTVSGTPQLFDNAFDYIWTVAIDPSNTSQEEVYAATYGGLRRSTDGGSSWTVVKGGFSNSASSYTDIAITSAGVVYATFSQYNLAGTSSSDRGIWRSTDGITWTNITPASWPTNYDRVVLAIAPSNENVVYFLAETPGSGSLGHNIWKYTYLSGDGSGSGGVWSDRTSNLPAYGGYVGDFDSQGSYDLVIKVKPDDENVVFIGGTNLYRSTDGFATSSNTAWIGGYSTANDVSMYPDQHPDEHAIVFLPSNPLVMYSGNDGGVQKTVNDLGSGGQFPVTWTTLNNGYRTGQFYTVAIDHATSGNDIVVGGMQDNGTWFTNTANAVLPWVDVDYGDGSYCAIANGRTYYYTSSQYAWISKNIVDNNGNVTNWTRIDPTGGSGYLFVNPFILDPNNSNIMYLSAGAYVWRNSDLTGIAFTPSTRYNTKTTNWTKLTSTYVSSATVSALGVSTSPANRLYYGTSDGRVFRLDGANTGSPTPTNVTGAGFIAGTYVSCIAVDPTDADHAIVAFSNYSIVSLYSTTDGGTTWSSVAGNLEQYSNGLGDGPSCRWVTILPSGYFVGTSTGLYSTATLNGSSTVWVQEGASTVGNVVVDMIDTRVDDGFIVIGTHGNGVYAATVPPGPPPIPLLVSPADGTSGEPTTGLTLSWDSSAGATTYRLQVATDSLFASLVLDDSTVATTSRSISGLSINTTYFWRVSARNENSASVFSQARTFTTVLANPVLLLPLVGDAHQQPTTLLVWSHVDGATMYRVQLSPSLSFVTTLIDTSFVIDTALSVGSLAASTTYYWRVAAKNLTNSSFWSDPSHFSTISNAPATVTLLYPPNADTGISSTPILRWRVAVDATTYHVQVAFDSMFLSVAVDDSSIADTTHLVGPLSSSMLLYWRVRAENVIGTSVWSSAFSFTTTNQVVASIPVARQWNIISVPVTVADPRPSVVFPSARSYAFSYQGAYIRQDSIRSGFGYWLKFDTAQAVVISGTNRVQDSIPVIIGWNLIGSINAPVPVQSVMSDPPGMATSNFYGYNHQYIVADTIKPGSGYWVRASQDGKLVLSSIPFLAKSSPTAVRIIPTSDMPPPPPSAETNEVGNLPTRFALDQNYPNPFNPTTDIRYQVAAASRVTLRVYDVLGREVATLVDDFRQAGVYTVRWNAAHMPSGVYFYRLFVSPLTMELLNPSGQIASFTATRKMLLTR